MGKEGEFEKGNQFHSRRGGTPLHARWDIRSTVVASQNQARASAVPLHARLILNGSEMGNESRRL